MDMKTRRDTGRHGSEVDPITLEIISSALRSITDETFVALTKSAYSTNIKERRDHSTAIMDPGGRLIAEAAQALPIHIASMNGLIACLLEKYRDDIHEGDLFIANDPHPRAAPTCPTSATRCRCSSRESCSASSRTSRTTRTSAAWPPARWRAG